MGFPSGAVGADDLLAHRTLFELPHESVFGPIDHRVHGLCYHIADADISGLHADVKHEGIIERDTIAAWRSALNAIVAVLSQLADESGPDR
jgi:hypothetical protein